LQKQKSAPSPFPNGLHRRGWTTSRSLKRGWISTCQKHNLRVCSASLNAFNRSTLLANNSSGEEGIYWSEQKQKWIAEIIWQGKKIYCGTSTDLADLGAIRRDVKESLLNNGLIQEALKLRKLTRKPPTSK